MKLVKRKKEDLDFPYPVIRYGKNQRLIQAFIDSDETLVEVLDYKHKNAHVCQSSMLGSIRRMKVRNIHVVVREGRVFMLKE